jgi:hypothetical protein
MSGYTATTKGTAGPGLLPLLVLLCDLHRHEKLTTRRTTVGRAVCRRMSFLNLNHKAQAIENLTEYYFTVRILAQVQRKSLVHDTMILRLYNVLFHVCPLAVDDVAQHIEASTSEPAEMKQRQQQHIVQSQYHII